MHARQRHYGMDWLRIAAFALLILYHIAMVFSPWSWVVKWPHVAGWLAVPMASMTPWRLPLLFVVSGFATRRLLARGGGVATFLRTRSVRLLVPLGFAMTALLPPELWVRACEAGYAGSLAHYWATDYWSAHPARGLGFPAWEHLWFVVYLWTYTMMLGAVIALDGLAPLDRAAAWVTRGRRLLWVPVALLVTARLALLFVVPDRHGLTSDWAGHAEYIPMFVFGLALGHGDGLWPAVRRQARAATAIAIACGAVVITVEQMWPGERVPPHAVMALDRAAAVAMAWTTAIALLAFADRCLNRDHRWRATLAEAVFPAYLIHHPLIVVTAWALLPAAPPAGVAFAIIAAVTIGGSVGFYLIARDTAWLRPLAGLSPRAPVQPVRRLPLPDGA